MLRRQLYTICISIVVACSTIGADAAPLRILTWNVHGVPFTRAAQRLPRIAEEVLRQRPDFVLLEEVWFRHQAWRVRSLLEPEGYVCVEYTRSPFRRGGLLLFVDTTKGWSVAQTEFHRYRRAAPWWRLTELDGIARKGFVIAALERRDGLPVTVIVTHLQSAYPQHGRTYEAVRAAQVSQLAANVTARDGVIILGGDFNSTPDDASHAYDMLTAAGLTDETAIARSACITARQFPCGTCFDGKRRSADWIDFIWVRGGTRDALTQVVRNDSADNPFSDHDAIVTTIELKP